jgi:interferon, gamma-inducible protein 30
MRAFVLLAVFAAVAADAVPKVSVGLYVESLCPYCRRFITDTFAKTLDAAGVKDVIDVAFVPWGNAKLVDGNVTCQHGADECVGNIIQVPPSAQPLTPPSRPA